MDSAHGGIGLELGDLVGIKLERDIDNAVLEIDEHGVAVGVIAHGDLIGLGLVLAPIVITLDCGDVGIDLILLQTIRAGADRVFPPLLISVGMSVAEILVENGQAHEEAVCGTVGVLENKVDTKAVLVNIALVGQYYAVVGGVAVAGGLHELEGVENILTGQSGAVGIGDAILQLEEICNAVLLPVILFADPGSALTGDRVKLDEVIVEQPSNIGVALDGAQWVEAVAIGIGCAVGCYP